jgi:D-3-phosphoglycerate dehydrogenase / 2-oxoglutarate reductase
MPKVLISDKMSPRAAEIFRQRGLEVDEKPGLSMDELVRIIGRYDGLAVRSATRVTAEVLDAADNLKVIGRAGIGVDNIDVRAATQAGICVMNTPYGNSITTAEHAIALMMALCRQIPLADRSTQDGRWEKNRFMGVELYGKTLGVIGCGNIGAIVCDRARGLRMKVVAFDPYLSPDRAADLGVEKVDLPELLARADIITLHTPMTESTRGILNRETIAQCKPGVRIVNCARGGLVVEEDLRVALDSGHVAGAAFDVFVEEPAKNNILFGHENFIATPHLGASTEEAQENVAVQVAEQLADFLIAGAVSNAINMPSVTAEEAPRLKPYLKLAQQLGSFAGQLTESSISKVHIEYLGQVARLNTRPLSAVMLLAPLVDTVNMVNARVIAEERGLDVVESTSERSGDYHALLRLTVTTEKQTRSIAGTLFADSRPRIVQVKDIELEAELGRYMLYLTNRDEPGYIGALGTALGSAGVNIATFHLGRTAPGGNAIALVETDSLVGEDVLKVVRALPQVTQAKALTFDGAV